MVALESSRLLTILGIVTLGLSFGFKHSSAVQLKYRCYMPFECKHFENNVVYKCFSVYMYLLIYTYVKII